jgi:hypothetical protein
LSQPQITDLDNVALLGNAALTAIPRWQAACAKFTGSCFIPPLPREEAASLPDEQAQIDPDGGLSLVITVRGEPLSLRVAEPGEWQWRQ